MIVAGIGCRKGCSADEIIALVGLAVERAGIANCRFTALAAPAFKAREPGLGEAAARLALPLLFVDEGDMKAAEPHCQTRSKAALEATGFASVAEAAALAVAGTGASLVLPRIDSERATCALAQRSRGASE
jgi:cobalt-precorrin 5A hydrolase